MFGIGFPELIIILVVALIVVGPSKLPDLAKSLGKGLSEFRKATDEIKGSLHEHEAYQDLKHVQQSFKETLDSVKPQGLLDDVQSVLEPKKPELDLSGRQTLMETIEAEVAAAPRPAAEEAKPTDGAAPPDQAKAPGQPGDSDGKRA